MRDYGPNLNAEALQEFLRLWVRLHTVHLDVEKKTKSFGGGRTMDAIRLAWPIEHSLPVKLERWVPSKFGDRRLHRDVIIHKCRGSYVAFSINKSVEPNEELKVG